MAKDKNSGIDKLKKDKSVKPLPKQKMGNLKGGRKKSRWPRGCGGIAPQ